MSVNNKRIPLLHFPEYSVDDNSWGEKKIGDTVKTISPPVKLQSNEFKKIGKYPIVDQSQKYICGYSDDSSAIIPISKDGCVVFGDHTCALKYIDFPFIQGADGIKILISNNTNAVSTRYLYQFLNAFPIVSKEYKRHFSELKEKIFLYPLLIDEQDKIADCLFAIDSCIASINEKIEQLKAHKKGLMQKLFPQNGQTVPEYRFPQFKNEEAWVPKAIKEVASVYQGYGFPDELQGKKEGRYPFIKVSDISFAVKNGERHIRSSINYVDEFEINTLKATPFPARTIIFAKIGEAIRLNRRVILNQASLFDNNVAGIKANSEILNDDLLYYILSMLDLTIYAGGVVPAVKKTTLENIEILLPKSKEEMSRIADTLVSYDNLFFAHKQKINLLEQQKKSLIQQLFPKP